MNQDNPLYKTRFYSDCIGVFQGGGCRVAAFAGAYEAAFNLGVRLTEVAGTSAGAIVAALLAAGAEADYLVEKVQSIEFDRFLAEPRRSIFHRQAKTLRVLQKLP